VGGDASRPARASRRLEVDELRDYLRFEIALRQEEAELVWREEQMRILANVFAETAT
jgi:hypothetical protein